MDSGERAAELLVQVMTVAGQVTGRMHVALEQLDLTEPIANLMWVLQPGADPLSLRKLAGLLHCDPSNVTLLSAKLEEKGLAERRPHPNDGRIRTLVLTDRGREVRERMLEVVARRSPLSGLDDAEQEQLQALLAKAISTG